MERGSERKSLSTLWRGIKGEVAGFNKVPGKSFREVTEEGIQIDPPIRGTKAEQFLHPLTIEESRAIPVSVLPMVATHGTLEEALKEGFPRGFCLEPDLFHDIMAFVKPPLPVKLEIQSNGLLFSLL
jgi:hypothetical protein